jgi:hypothetical protein
MITFLFGAVMFLLGGFFGMLIIGFGTSVQRQVKINKENEEALKRFGL